MPHPLTRPKILIIEDNPENRGLMAEILREIATCVFAATAQEAFEIIGPLKESRAKFSLILLDLELPEISGLQIIEKIRKEEAAAGIRLGEGVPIVVVTGHQRRFLEAFDKGCDEYLLKPIDAASLISKATSILVKQ